MVFGALHVCWNEAGIKCKALTMTHNHTSLSRHLHDFAFDHPGGTLRSEPWSVVAHFLKIAQSQYHGWQVAAYPPSQGPSCCQTV